MVLTFSYPPDKPAGAWRERSRTGCLVPPSSAGHSRCPSWRQTAARSPREARPARVHRWSRPPLKVQHSAWTVWGRWVLVAVDAECNWLTVGGLNVAHLQLPLPLTHTHTHTPSLPHLIKLTFSRIFHLENIVSLQQLDSIIKVGQRRLRLHQNTCCSNKTGALGYISSESPSIHYNNSSSGNRRKQKHILRAEILEKWTVTIQLQSIKQFPPKRKDIRRRREQQRGRKHNILDSRGLFSHSRDISKLEICRSDRDIDSLWGSVSSVMTYKMSHRARRSQRPAWAQTSTVTHYTARWFSRHSMRRWPKACPRNTAFQQTTRALSAHRERGQTEREREKETAHIQYYKRHK